MFEFLFKVVLPFFHHYGYHVLFFSSFLESLPLVGIVVPGATIAVFGGYVVKRHALHFSLALTVLTLGAFLGDVANYFIGRHYGYSFLKKYGKYIFLTEARLEYVRNHVQKNRGKTLILGRFTSITRSITPFVAGASHVEVLPFLGFTFLSAFLWAFSHLLIGFVFGRWLERISRYLGLFFFLAILIGVGLIYIYRFINQRHHVFKRLHIYTLLGMVFSLFVFSSTLDDVLKQEWLFTLDHLVRNFIFTIQRPWLTTIMVFITHLGDASVLICLISLLVIFLVSKKRYYMACLTIFSFAFGEALQFILKEAINLPRPGDALVQTTLPAFPSGHSTSAMILGAFFFLTFLDYIHRRAGKYVLFFVTLFGVLLIGFSRIYVNAHWTTDVIAGFSVGLFSVTFSILFFRIVVFAKKWLD